MSRERKLGQRIQRGPQGVRWRDFVKAANLAGFTMRKTRRGSGYIFERSGDQVVLAVHKPHGNRPVDPAAVKQLKKFMDF